jgi:hypothetical protein
MSDQNLESLNIFHTWTENLEISHTWTDKLDVDKLDVDIAHTWTENLEISLSEETPEMTVA